METISRVACGAMLCVLWGLLDVDRLHFFNLNVVKK